MEINLFLPKLLFLVMVFYQSSRNLNEDMDLKRLTCAWSLVPAGISWVQLQGEGSMTLVPALGQSEQVAHQPKSWQQLSTESMETEMALR